MGDEWLRVPRLVGRNAACQRGLVERGRLPLTAETDALIGVPHDELDSRLPAVVERFHQLVLGDGRLAAFFDGADMAKLRQHAALLISQVLGGQPPYDRRALRRAHAGMAIGPEDYLRVVSYLAQTLVETKAPPAVIRRVNETLAAMRPHVVLAG